MTQVLHDLFHWFKDNKFTVNLDKTCFTILKKKKKDYLNNIQFENMLIKKVLSAKYLGVVLDENLYWKDHISTLNKIPIKTSNSFKIIKHQVPQINKLTFIMPTSTLRFSMASMFMDGHQAQSLKTYKLTE